MRALVTLLGILLVSYSSLLAQPNSGPGTCLDGNGNPIPCDPGAPVPVSGIEILLTAGAALGARRLMASRKLKT